MQNLTPVTIRLNNELAKQYSNYAASHNISRQDLIAKILAGDELSAEDEAFIAEKQEKQAEREAQKAIMQAIKEKLGAGEELTSEEQSLLGEMKENKPEGKGTTNKSGSRGEK